MYPNRAYQTSSGQVVLGRSPPDAGFQTLRLACGKCIGCRTDTARHWAFRCELELKDHRSALFTTLTYSDAHLPITLEPRHLQLWLKRLRWHAPEPVRFFASGEYGTHNTTRPHYHAIIFGLGREHSKLVDAAWGLGHTRTYPVCAKAIRYVAGYTGKKCEDYWPSAKEERIDYETGEVYTWRAPFIQMSRKPGIGGSARKYINSWRSFAIYDGYKMSVPRFLHDAWKKQATDEQLEQLQRERTTLSHNRDNSEPRLRAREAILHAQQKRKTERRML